MFIGKQLSTQEIRISCLDMLEEIHRISKLLGLRYFLGWGTLLGAVRHKGFIPWDDDIDICMLRKEYEILVSKFNDLANPRYRLICAENTKNYLWAYAKVIDVKTSLKEFRLIPEFDYGLFVDIFPLDYVSISGEDEKRKLQKQLILFNRRQMITAIRYAPWRWKICNFWNFIIYKGRKRFSYFFADASSNNIKCDRFLSNLSNGEKTDMLLATFSQEPKIDKLLFRSEWYSDAIEWDFEGRRFMVPSEYDAILRTMYGNYMKLPPENKRKGEHFKSVRWR